MNGPKLYTVYMYIYIYASPPHISCQAIIKQHRHRHQAETLRWLARSGDRWSNDAGFALKSLNGRSLEVP